MVTSLSQLRDMVTTLLQPDHNLVDIVNSVVISELHCISTCIGNCIGTDIMGVV